MFERGKNENIFHLIYEFLLFFHIFRAKQDRRNVPSGADLPRYCFYFLYAFRERFENYFPLNSKHALFF